MKRSAYLAAALVAGALGCQRCGAGSGQPAAASPAAAGPAPVGTSTRLATVPAGVEVGEAAFARDGRHVLWIAKAEGKVTVHVDDEAGRPHEGAKALAWHEATGSAAYVAFDGGKDRAVVGGQEGPAFDEIGAVQFTPAGRAFYAGRRGEAWVVVAGDRERAVPGATAPTPRLTGDGRWIVWVEGAAGGKVALRACGVDLSGCVASPPRDAIEEVAVDPAGPRVAFGGAVKGGVALVTATLDGSGIKEVAGPEAFVSVTRVTFTADGQHLACLLERPDGYTLQSDDARHPLPAMDSPLDLVAAGGHTLFSAIIQNRVVAFLDGQQVVSDLGSIDFPALSRDGTAHVVATAADGRELIVVNGKRGPPYDKVVTPRFTPDGTKVVYRARQAGERFVVVADAAGKTLREHPHYEAVYDVVIAPDGKSVGYGVRKGAELRWVVEPL